MTKGFTTSEGRGFHSTLAAGRSACGAHRHPVAHRKSFLPVESPPWAKQAQWSTIQTRIEKALSGENHRLQDLHRAGESLSDRMAALHPLMEELAAVTCTRCPAPCCLTARIWFDLKDLLALHLSKRPPPPAQTIAKMADRCRYLGPRGCRLDRQDRPWVCTWYLCPTQRDRLRKENAAAYDRLQQEMKEIGAARKRMLKEFLQAGGIEKREHP